MTDIMNKSLIAFLAEGSTVKGVLTVYDEEKYKEGLETPTFYKTTMQNIKVGDIAIVPTSTRFGFTTNKVVEVDVEPDFGWTREVKWIVGALGTEAYEQCLEYEKAIMDAFQKSERDKLKRKMKKQLNDAAKSVPLPKVTALPAQ